MARNSSVSSDPPLVGLTVERMVGVEVLVLGFASLAFPARHSGFDGSTGIALARGGWVGVEDAGGGGESISMARGLSTRAAPEFLDLVDFVFRFAVGSSASSLTVARCGVDVGREVVDFFSVERKFRVGDTCVRSLGRGSNAWGPISLQSLGSNLTLGVSGVSSTAGL